MPNIKQFKNKKEYNEWYKKYRDKNRVKIRNYNRKYNKKWRKERGYHNEINSNKRYPEKRRARVLLEIAVRLGKIKRGNCEVCNKPNSQGHHENYSRFLDVRWLCPLHHTNLHKKISTG